MRAAETVHPDAPTARAARLHSERADMEEPGERG